MMMTYKFRLKDSNSRKHLERHSRAVNFVWNYCCGVQRKAESNWRAGMVSKWPSHFTLTGLTNGIGKELGIGSEVIGEVCRMFSVARSAIKRHPNFRASSGSRRALGWVPFRGRRLKVVNGSVVWLGQTFRFWQSREIVGQIKTAAFVQDASGRWFVTFQCEVDDLLPTGSGEVGIDLGLKSLAVLSDGSEIPIQQNYRRYEKALGKAQRANNRKRVRAIHSKIANSRRHQLHVASAMIARENKLIVVGNVNAAKLKRTKMAKSVSDAGWSMFRTMLRYKASRHGATFIEADERYTSVTCSECGALSGPKGQKGLRIRSWECSECGSSHDRDGNAARNILRIGQECLPPSVGIAA